MSSGPWRRAARWPGVRSRACRWPRTTPALPQASGAPYPHPRVRSASRRTTRATPAGRCALELYRHGGWRPCDAPPSASTRGRNARRSPHGVLVAPITVLGATPILQIARAPVGDLGSVPQWVRGCLKPCYHDEVKGVIPRVDKRCCCLRHDFSRECSSDFSRHLRFSFRK